MHCTYWAGEDICITLMGWKKLVGVGRSGNVGSDYILFLARGMMGAKLNFRG